MHAIGDYAVFFVICFRLWILQKCVDKMFLGASFKNCVPIKQGCVGTPRCCHCLETATEI